MKLFGYKKTLHEKILMETSYEQYKVDSHRHNAYEYFQIYTSDIIHSTE